MLALMALRTLGLSIILMCSLRVLLDRSASGPWASSPWNLPLGEAYAPEGGRSYSFDVLMTFRSSWYFNDQAGVLFDIHILKSLFSKEMMIKKQTQEP